VSLAGPYIWTHGGHLLLKLLDTLEHIHHAVDDVGHVVAQIQRISCGLEQFHHILGCGHLSHSSYLPSL